MRTYKSLTTTLATVLTAATIATSFPLASASAAPVNKPAASKATTLDISARRYHRYHRGGNAAAAAAFAGIVGTIGALAIAHERRQAWRDRYYNGYPYGGYGYGYGPRYYPY